MNIQQTASTPKLVTMIPADPQMTERDIRNKHLRIAPYCRVSHRQKGAALQLRGPNRILHGKNQRQSRLDAGPTLCG